MLKKFRQLVKEKGLGKWFQRDNLIILILSGVLLLIIAMPTKDSGSGLGTQKDSITGDSPGSISQRSTFPESTSMENTSRAAGSNGEESFWGSLSEYEAALEEQLEQILEGMAGAGAVRVMITFSSSQELVVEKDRPVTRSNTTESDSEGGSRSIYQIESGETTVYNTQGTDSEPYVVKTLTPKVEGVVIAAEGAGTGEVTKNITEAVQALFDLEAHKIKVVKMNTGD